MMKKTSGLALIGRDGADYIFCDSVFDHGDGFHGCTGFQVRPVGAEAVARRCLQAPREGPAETRCQRHRQDDIPHK